MDILEIIQTRRSIRKFQDRVVDTDLIQQILEAGRWAPSGLNNQPWRFAVVKDPSVKEQISGLTHYQRVVRGAQALIAVFLDNDSGYHRIKDAQAIGACVQNMLLEAHALGLGAVWLGEIIKSDEAVRKVLDLGNDLELMAVVALGHPDEKMKKGTRKKLSELVVYNS